MVLKLTCCLSSRMPGSGASGESTGHVLGQVERNEGTWSWHVLILYLQSVLWCALLTVEFECSVEKPCVALSLQKHLRKTIPCCPDSPMLFVHPEVKND